MARLLDNPPRVELGLRDVETLRERIEALAHCQGEDEFLFRVEQLARGLRHWEERLRGG